MSDESTLHMCEIPYPSGAVRFRFARVPSEDGTAWVRHGLFVAYHENGQVSSEGMYERDAEEGPWRDYHDNGRLAAEGLYRAGKEHGVWRYWAPDGTEEAPIEYIDGEEVG